MSTAVIDVPILCGARRSREVRHVVEAGVEGRARSETSRAQSDPAENSGDLPVNSGACQDPGGHVHPFGSPQVEPGGQVPTGWQPKVPSQKPEPQSDGSDEQLSPVAFLQRFPTQTSGMA